MRFSCDLRKCESAVGWSWVGYHGRLLAEGELNCTRCYEAGAFVPPFNLFPFTEIMPEGATAGV